MSEYAQAAIRFRGDREGVLALEVPCSWKLMQKGLQHRRRLAADRGMLFVSREWPHPQPIIMWMASVSFPLAMIWLGADGRVSRIKLALPGDPEDYQSSGLAVVETNAAFVEEIGLRKGDSFDLAWPGGKFPCRWRS